MLETPCIKRWPRHIALALTGREPYDDQDQGDTSQIETGQSDAGQSDTSESDTSRTDGPFDRGGKPP